MGQTGNKGEWSEFYTFVKLLSTGKLYAANGNMQRINNLYLPILKIIRKESPQNTNEYIISTSNNAIEIHLNKNLLKKIPQDDLAEMADYIFNGIADGSNRAFEIDGSEKIMQELFCSKIAAPSNDKTDITMQVHDIYTGFNPVCGFSIKSELGNPPTLLNASKATNFVFEVKRLTQEDAFEINKIETKSKIIDRIKAIYKKGSLKYYKLENEEFFGNLMLIDSDMDKILAAMLLEFYRNNISECTALIASVENSNPLKFPRKGIYEYKIKKFLCSIALGMVPSTQWNGQDEANGGYIIVKDDGDIVAYYLYNRNMFEDYLLNNTYLEKASTTRHDFASIYKGSNGKLYINLNLQIRFLK